MEKKIEADIDKERAHLERRLVAQVSGEYIEETRTDQARKQREAKQVEWEKRNSHRAMKEPCKPTRTHKGRHREEIARKHQRPLLYNIVRPTLRLQD